MSSPSSIVGRKETSAIKPRQKFEGHTDSVDTAVIYLPDGQRMMTCSRDGSLRVWNVKSGKQIGDYREGDINTEVRTIALSPDGKKVVSGSLDGRMRLWDMDTGKVIGKWTGHTATVWSVCWSQDGRRVVSGSFDGTAREWDVEKGDTILGPIETGHTHVYSVVYSPDMTMFATAGYYQWDLDDEYEDSVKIWDAKTGELIATLNGHTQMVHCLAWTPDGKTLVSTSNDQSIRTWNTTTWKQIALLKHPGIAHAIAISPNGRILASASNTTSQLWNVDNNQPIGPPLQHAPWVNSVSFSPDGKLLATGCNNHNAYTWDVTAILKEAGLDDLLDQRDNSLLAADTTRRPVRQPIKVQNRIPRGFFDDTHGAHLSPRHSLQPLSSSSSHGITLRDYFLSLFRSTDPGAHDTTPSQPHPFHWVRNRLSGRPSGVDIELHEHPSAEVDVPHCQAKRRNACAREKRRPVPKNPTAGTSRPPNSNTTQQSNGTAQAQSPSQTQPQAISRSSVALEATTSSTNAHATIKHAGRWTRFWLFVCCASPEYADCHH